MLLLLNHISFENFHSLNVALPLRVLPFLSSDISSIPRTQIVNLIFELKHDARVGRDERQWVKSSKSIPNLHQSTENIDEENYTRTNSITGLIYYLFKNDFYIDSIFRLNFKIDYLNSSIDALNLRQSRAESWPLQWPV